ncbi:MAG: dihydropteroate synthase [Burkholderiales bacterium]|jgi:dihydropteroate synthase|nr:dihydropteroate synthase [Burkholderiales bacterium]
MPVSQSWQCGQVRLDLARPRIMGVVNVTPDSFSDDGRHFDRQVAIDHGLQLIAEGADILDIGGESTRPNAPEVRLEEELRRVLPVIEALAAHHVPLSIDTSKPEVMRRALAAGAVIVNDVRALQEPGAVETVAASDCGVVLMHMQGTPRTMQADPHYDDVVADVGGFLRARFEVLRAASVAAERVLLDPGFGFGKTLEHNLRLLARLRALDVPAPLLVGLSRKSMLGAVTGRGVRERVHASVAAALIAVQNGAQVVRVHDVAATRDALALWAAVQARDQDPKNTDA